MLVTEICTTKIQFMDKIAVINCGSKKKEYACPAREMYEGGSLFRKMRDYVEQAYDGYYILSGKYGLMHPDQIIEPYEDVVFFVQKIFRERAKKEGRVLKAVTKVEQAIWGKNVADKIDWNQFNEVNFHINIYYWDPLKKHFNHKPEKFIHHKFERRLGPNLKKLNDKLNKLKLNKL